MKKIITCTFLFLVLAGVINKSNAAVMLVEVEDFEFDPQLFTVNVGDTIMWVWDEGFHTTTSGAIPVGATPWDQQISSSSPVFIYVPTVPGTYPYDCTFHAAMGMIGSFTVTGTTGINDAPSLSFLKIKSDAGAKELSVNYSLQTPGNIMMRVYDIIGKPVRSESIIAVKSGEFEHVFSTNGLKNGIYIVEITSGSAKISRKLMLE